MLISIHAPARGATRPETMQQQQELLFQFTPLREGRPRSRAQGRRYNISIHAPARGATRHLAAVLLGRSDFNSRPCERGDRSTKSRSRFSTIFQFTPLREGRLLWAAAHCQWRSISIHAPARGATRMSTPLYPVMDISIHAPARGATHDSSHQHQRSAFQFTPLREGRQQN